MFECNATFPIYYLANRDESEQVPRVFAERQNGIRFVAES